MKNCIFLVCFLIVAATCGGLERVGEVVAVEGVLKAVDSSRVERSLLENSSVFVGDTLITGKVSKGEIQFLDGTLVLLIPGSRYSIDSFASSSEGENLYAAKLKQGGVRIATGLIAKKNPDNFQVGTPNATIGVRGTLFEVRMVKEDLFVGSSSGSVTLKNHEGTLSIGSDSPTQFAKVPSRRTAPQPLSERPQALSLANFTLPAGAVPFYEARSLPTGSGAASGASRGFAWGPAVGGLSVLGAVVGLVAGAASQTPPNYAHGQFSATSSQGGSLGSSH